MNCRSRKALIIFLYLAAMTAAICPLWVRAQATGDTVLSASRLTYEETESGAMLTLEGPVSMLHAGQTLEAANAVVELGDDLSSLGQALVSVTLDGGVSYDGLDGSRASAREAVYHARERRLDLRGGVSFARGDFDAQAGAVRYETEDERIELSGGCHLRSGPITAQASEGTYDLTAENGNLSGAVEVRYDTETVRFGDEVIEEVVLRAERLEISANDGLVRTPSGMQGRAVIEAGAFRLEAATIVFRGQESELAGVTAEGSVTVSGPDIDLSADSVTFETADSIVRATGSVEFRVFGQSGHAEMVELNFDHGWSVRLQEGGVEGTVDETDLSGEAPAPQN